MHDCVLRLVFVLYLHICKYETNQKNNGKSIGSNNNIQGSKSNKHNLYAFWVARVSLIIN